MSLDSTHAPCARLQKRVGIPHSRAQHPVAQASFAMAFCRSSACSVRAAERMDWRLGGEGGQGRVGQGTCTALGVVQLGRVKGELVLLGAVGRALDRAHLEGMRGGRLAVAPLRRLGAEEIIAVQIFRHECG